MATREAQLKIVIDAQDRTQGTFRNLNSQLGTSQGALSSFTSKAGLMTAALGAATAAAAALGATVMKGFNVAAQLQTAQIGLETLLGSADAAASTVARLKKEAARTPFELPGLTQATQLLSSVTKDGNRSINILLDIGEALAAMGKGQAELDRIIVNLQQVGAIGHASMVDIKQFAFAGIPIFEMLKEETGLAGDALADFISQGGVTFEKLVVMFDEANNAGGRFFNAFQNQAGSYNQVLSNLKDSFGIFAAELVTQTGIFDAFTKVMQVAASLLTAYGEGMKNVKANIAGFLAAIEEKTGLVTLLKDAWANLVMVFDERLKPALLDLWEKLEPFRPFLDAMVKVFGTMLVIAIGATIMIVGALAIALVEVLTQITAVASYLLGTFGRAWDFITDRISAAIEKVEKFISLMKKALSLVGNLPGKAADAVGKVIGVNDAIIAPNGNIITTHPDDYLIATKNPRSLMGGGGITVNIMGGTYLSEDAAEQIGDSIIQRLTRSTLIPSTA